MTSKRARVAHVVRRLSMGVHPDLLEGLPSPDAAIARALDLSAPPAAPAAMAVPATLDEARDRQAIAEPIAWWLERMRSPQRLIEERLVWFWHDHFATGLAKVRVPYLMYQQHLTIRRHATGSFAELLKEIAKDPAMLVYLDGVTNSRQARNENFGREVMELFTVGRGEYTQADVVDCARAFGGWAVNGPGRGPGAGRAAAPPGTGPWQAFLVPARFDAGTKTLLGTTGALDADTACDVLLGHPTTAPRIAAKLYTELVGLTPDARTTARLGKRFGSDWDVLALVEAIAADRAFASDAAVRARVRTPIEKLVALLQVDPAAAPGSVAPRRAAGGSSVGDALVRLAYVPFAPPRVDGFPKGSSLLDPHHLVHGLDLLAVFPRPPAAAADADTLLARFGLFDVSTATSAAVRRERDPGRRVVAVAASPEFALT